MEIKKDLEKKCIEFIENNQPEIYWEYKDFLGKKRLQKILETQDTLDIENDIYENSFDYICELESVLCKQLIEELELEKTFPGITVQEVHDHFMDYIHVDLNFDTLLRNTPDLLCFVVFYSDYDCTTSTQAIDDKTEYLGAIWERVEKACNKKDFLNEFANGYTAELFCFAFKTDIKTLIDLKQNFKQSIRIPKNTQYGFFGNFNGSGSVFEARTIEECVFPKFEPNKTQHDKIEIIADIEQGGYDFVSVYGGADFIDNQTIEVE
jgi:hypothetical protein